MKKVLFTSMVLLSVLSWTGNVYAQDAAGGDNTEVTTPSESSASVTFSEDGTTLTISGQGDLTTYNVPISGQVFTAAANGNVSTDEWNDVNLEGEKYDASATYYKKVGYGYVKIDDNSAFFAENANYLSTTLPFTKILADKIAGGSFETVKFINESSENDLLINTAIIKNILSVYKTDGWSRTECNTNLINLDLGQTICKDLSSATFSTAGWLQSSNLTTLTLPKTIKTSVLSESTGKNEDKMIVPENILDGYHDKLSTITIPEGYDRLGEKAFYNRTKITTFNLPSTLTVIGNSAFQNCTALSSIELNKGLENIGKEAFAGTALTDITFPSSLKIINDAAFFELKIFNLKLNAGLKYIGNSAFGFKGNEVKEATLEIPASVRYIGPFAFAARYYQDVFFYGDRAPIMPIGKTPYIQDRKEEAAFSENTYMGTNGFNEGKLWKEGELYDAAYTQGYANRENYKNHGYYFTMLHFPKGLTPEKQEAYTDITRVYRTNGEGQTFRYGKTAGDPDTYVSVGKENEDLKYNDWTAPKDVDFGFKDTYLGEQYIWPSQEQWRRSYVVNSLGYKWDGVTEYCPKLDEGDLAILEYAGYKIGTGEGEYTEDELSKIAHLGTRQFVLANADVNVDEKEEKEPEYPINVKGGQWWTLCVPFNMTKKMVDDTFGENTEVCLFDKVKREINYKTKRNRIVLYFTQNVYKHKTEQKNTDGTWNFNSSAAAPADDEIVIYAHESYMIHPTKTDEDAKFVVKNYTPVVGSPTPTVVYGKNEIVGSSSDIRDDVPYRYVGNYLAKVDVQTATQSVEGVVTQSQTEVKIPKFSYVFAKAGNEAPKFWFLTDDGMVWMPNKCVVQTNTRGDGALDYDEFFDFKANSAKQASFFGEDFFDSTTSIEDDMIIIAGEGSDVAVYNLDGTLVNTTGDLTGLAKGIYIKGGKKYVVK